MELKRQRSLLSIVVAMCTGVALSFIIHAPWGVPNIYSDVVVFWYRTWFNAGNVPYATAASFFEYPPLAGGIAYLCRLIGTTLDSYYFVFGIFSMLAGLCIAWSVWRISKVRGSPPVVTLLVVPTIVLYAIYSFDLFEAMFILLSLQFALERRGTISAVATGLGISTKLVNVVLIPVFLAELKGTRERVKYVVLSLGTAALTLVPILVVNPSWVTEFLQYHGSWPLEDAWYVWIFPSSDSFGAARIFGLVVMLVLLFRVYTLKLPMASKSFLALAAYLLGTYVFSPQMTVVLIPLVAILALEHESFYLMDMFNALIILTWFVSPDPMSAGSIPQLMALLRAGSLVWLSLHLLGKEGYTLRSLFRLPRLGNRTPKVPLATETT